MSFFNGILVLAKDCQSLSRNIWSCTPYDSSVPHPPSFASEVSVNLTVQYMYTLYTMLCVSEVLGKEFISYYLFVLPALTFRRDLLKIVRQRKKALQSNGNWESFGSK